MRGHEPGLQAFVVFVVRDDARPSALLFQSSVTTFAAYNNWGGKSLYAFNSGGAPARKVSFDRPYASNPYGVRLDGAGDFLRRWEYNAVRFLEREGYDVSYSTDVDTHERPIVDATPALRHRVFLSVGHDEYWSAPMRAHVESARDRGVHLAFLGADACYWQIRFEPNARGEADRTIVGYKEAAGNLDPLALDGRPQNDRPDHRPLARSARVAARGAAGRRDVRRRSGRRRHHRRPGGSLGVRRHGSEERRRAAAACSATKWTPCPPAADRRRASASPTRRSPTRARRARRRYADMTMYSAESDALVFATGSIQWSWGLDGYNAPAWHTRRVSDAAQRITRNVLDRMLQTETRARRPAAGWLPSPIVLAGVGRRDRVRTAGLDLA